MLLYLFLFLFLSFSLIEKLLLVREGIRDYDSFFASYYKSTLDSTDSYFSEQHPFSEAFWLLS
jgi:hypothetical protein